MIKVLVKLSNEFDNTYDEVEITKEEILQLACDKAKEKYYNNYWNSAIADDELEINITH